MTIRAKSMTFVSIGVLVLAAAAGVAAASLGDGSSAGAPQTPSDDGIPFPGSRIPVSGVDGTAGYVDRSALASPSLADVTSQEEADQITAERNGRPWPVTATPDPDSELVGYFVPVLGFIDLATFTSPDFDLNARLAEVAAVHDKLEQYYEDQNGPPQPPVTELSK